jgi:hypothetical protein
MLCNWRALGCGYQFAMGNVSNPVSHGRTRTPHDPAVLSADPGLTSFNIRCKHVNLLLGKIIKILEWPRSGCFRLGTNTA